MRRDLQVVVERSCDLMDVPGVELLDAKDTRGPFTLSVPLSVVGTAAYRAAPRVGLNTIDSPLRPLSPLLEAASHIPLRDYQKVGIEFLFRAGQAILGDQMGLGKTRTAAAAALGVSARTGGSRPILIVAPKHLRSTWHAELAHVGALDAPHGESRRWCALEGRATRERVDAFDWKAFWYFCHYDILAEWWPQLHHLKPVVAIFDEAHLLKNRQSARTRGAQLAADAVPFRFLLTGTPILNRWEELHSMLSFTTGRGSWGNKRSFLTCYAGGMQDSYGAWSFRGAQPEHAAELRERLASCFLRRTTAEVLTELPPLTRQPIRVSLTPEALSKYTRFFDGLDPQEICRALLEGRASQNTLRLLDRTRKLVSHEKLPATLAELEGLLDAGVGTVCFTWLRATAEQIQAKVVAAGRRAYVVTGEYSDLARQAALDAFAASPDGELLVATYGALATGVNLQHARAVVMHDLDWVPATLLQAEGRVYRQGQTHPTISKWMVAEDTLDQLILNALADKAEVISLALDDAAPSSLASALGGRVERAVADFAASVARWRTT